MNKSNLCQWYQVISLEYIKRNGSTFPHIINETHTESKSRLYFILTKNDQIIWPKEHHLRSCTIFLMVRITEVPIFLIVFDLLFQMQEKSRRSISKKVRIALVDLIWGLSEIGRYALFWGRSLYVYIQIVWGKMRKCPME